MLAALPRRFPRLGPARARRALCALLLALLPGLAGAEQALREGPWVLHYMTLNTTELTPEVARSYGVTRSKRRGLLMLNLQRADDALRSVDHASSGTIRNLIGQTKLDELRRVEAGGAIYTLATYRYSHLETLRFDFEVSPLEAPGAPLRLQFSRQLYVPGR